ncbi:MAG: hypothetical protein AAGB48_10605 [Planctomycetota bacterium]
MINDSDAYKEALTSLRQFVTLVDRIRNAALIQTATIVAGYVVIVEKEMVLLQMLAAVFGSMASFVLLRLHRHYLAYFEDAQQWIIDAERRWSESDQDGFVGYVEKRRNDRVGPSTRGRWLALHGAFVLMSIIMAFIVVHAIWSYASSLDG